MSERVLFVLAHPGDETISAGQTIATLVDSGAEVTVLTCTRGEYSPVANAEFASLAEAPDALAARRERESAEALEILGVTDHRMLGGVHARWSGRSPRRYLDSTAPQGAAEHPLALSAASIEEVAADIAAVMIDVEPDVVVSHDLDDGTRNTDHDRVHEATRAAAEVIGVALYVLDSPDSREAASPNAVSVDSSSVDSKSALERKTRALAAYRSRVEVDGEIYTDPRLGARAVEASERFHRLRATSGSFAESGVVTRVATGLLALVLGVFVGGVLTAANHATVQLGGATIPWGAIVGVAVTSSMLAGLRLVFQSRIVPAIALLGLVAAAGALLFLAPGREAVQPDGVLQIVALLAPPVAGLLVVAWPQSRGAKRDRIKHSTAKGSDSP